MKKIVSLATMLSLLFSLPQSMVAFAEENGEKSAETTVSNPVEKATEANVVAGGASENTSEKANKETVVEKTTEPIVAETSAPTPSENTVTKSTQPEVVDKLLHTSNYSMSTKIFLKEKIGKDTDWRRTIDLEKTLKGVFVPENVRKIKPYEAELISISDDTYFVSLRGKAV